MGAILDERHAHCTAQLRHAVNLRLGKAEVVDDKNWARPGPQFLFQIVLVHLEIFPNAIEPHIESGVSRSFDLNPTVE